MGQGLEQSRETLGKTQGSAQFPGCPREADQEWARPCQVQLNPLEGTSHPSQLWDGSCVREMGKQLMLRIENVGNGAH